jgi:hypothetical protein
MDSVLLVVDRHVHVPIICCLLIEVSLLGLPELNTRKAIYCNRLKILNFSKISLFKMFFKAMLLVLICVPGYPYRSWDQILPSPKLGHKKQPSLKWKYLKWSGNESFHFTFLGPHYNILIHNDDIHNNFASQLRMEKGTYRYSLGRLSQQKIKATRVIYFMF